MNSKDRFCLRGGGLLIQAFFFNSESDGASLNTGSSLFYSDKPLRQKLDLNSSVLGGKF